MIRMTNTVARVIPSNRVRLSGWVGVRRDIDCHR